MKKEKKIILQSIVFVLTAIFLLACSKDSTNKKNSLNGAKVTDTMKENTSTEKEKDKKDTVETLNQKNTDDNSQDKIRDISSIELVKEMKIGWSLGNTLDATGNGNSIRSETSWSNPITSKDMIDTVKNAGFNTLRVPITWQNHLGPAPNYKIDKMWLDRVQIIVDYGIKNDMFVIINPHHDEWYYPSYKNLELAKSELIAVWKQIAERFKNYDEHLIFEGLNEPRLKGTDLEWTGGNEESWDVINQLNATFIDTIRKADGNNSLRHLMVPPYAASSLPKTWDNFIVPKDDKVIVSIHAYIPYNFALNKSGGSTWNKDNSEDTIQIDNMMNNIDSRFISKGTPVIIGEFGAMNKNNINDRVAWAEYYVKKAKEKGIVCIWWDNGAFNGQGENFGMLNRIRHIWKYPELIDALMKGLD